MKTYKIEKSRVSYIPAFDILYVGYGDNRLDKAEQIVDLGSGITIMFNNGEFSGAEIYDFVEHYGQGCTRITIEADEPFVLDMSQIT